jgi:hypothetical protein
LSIKEIKSHKFFKDIDWSEVKKKSTRPPFIPEIDDPFTLAYASNKYEMYSNPMYQFKEKNSSDKQSKTKIVERKFNPLGNFQIKRINRVFENF